MKLYVNICKCSAGKCFKLLNVTLGSSADEEGHQRFFPFNPELHLIPTGPILELDWYWEYRAEVTTVRPCSECDSFELSLIL